MQNSSTGLGDFIFEKKIGARQKLGENAFFGHFFNEFPEYSGAQRARKCARAKKISKNEIS